MSEEKPLDQGTAVPPQVEEKAERGVKHARKAAKDLGSATGEIVKEYRGKAEQAWEDTKDRVQTFREDTDHYVRENPTKSIFTALGVGLVLGLMIRRR